MSASYDCFAFPSHFRSRYSLRSGSPLLYVTMDLATEGEGTIVDNQIEWTGAIPVAEQVET